MKRKIKRIAQLIGAFCFAAMLFTACEDGSEEIFDNADAQEQMVDEENEKKQKPGGS